jgi:hypothetical protein
LLVVFLIGRRIVASQVIVNRLEQGEDWRLDRCGSVGASEIADVLRKGKGGAPSLSCASLMARKVCERITGKPVATFKSRAMDDGIMREPRARSLYEITYGEVELVGKVPHPRIEGTHASPERGAKHVAEVSLLMKKKKAANVLPCTCHPDDKPPRPCPQKYAYSECVAAAAREEAERAAARRNPRQKSLLP